LFWRDRLTETALGTIATGAAISVTGQFTPFMIAGSAMMTVAAGLISTFSVTSTTGARIGYQVLAGFGVGLCCQAPILAAQALAEPTDLAAATAMLLFFQAMGGALMVSAAETGFTNTLIRKLVEYAPGIDVAHVLNTGASELRATFSGDELTAILASYTDGLQVSFSIVIALTGLATLAGLAMPWKSIKST
jgi:MFS transporter, DHA2 family, glioxin efflux transporter